MKVTEKTVNSLFCNRVQYKIPLFQRHYVWDKEDQWRPLWNDIKDRFSQKGTHFTGTLVIQKETQSNNGGGPKNEIYEIIDGQQRLTTFQIILCALRDLAKKIKYKDLEEEANTYILNRRTLQGSTERYKLVPRDLDKESFLQLVDGDLARSTGRIRGSYDYFKLEIANYVQDNRDKISILYESILSNFSFVQILLDPEDEPEKIFESLNARGKRLLQFDLLRNNLFLRAHQDRDRLYREYWDHFETSYWDPEERSGTSSEMFLQHFLMAKLGTEKVKPEFNIYQRQYGRNLEGPVEVEYEFSELKRYSQVYQEIMDCKDDSDVGRRMKFYQTFDLTTLHPFILFVICEVELSGKKLDFLFDILESYTIRRMLCSGGKRALKNYNIFFSEIIKDLTDNFSLENFVKRLSDETSNTRKYPSDDEIEPALYPRYDEHPILIPEDSAIVFPDNRSVKAALDGLWVKTAGQIQRRLIRYILYRVELMKRRENSLTETNKLFFDDRLTLEHVMPIKWKETWTLPVGEGILICESGTSGNYNISLHTEAASEELFYQDLFSDTDDLERPSRNNLAEESYSEAFNLALARDNLLQSVGNLTVVTEKLNASMSNRPFSKKREGLYENSLLILNKEIHANSNWDINEIQERSKKLIDDVCRIWPSLDWFTENIT